MQNQRLKQLRLALHLSQENLGTALGITRSGVSSIESGSRKLSEKHIKLLLAAYPNINENWLRTGEGNMFQDNDKSILGELTAKFHLDNLDIKILEAYLKLPSQQRAVIKHFIAGIAAETVADPIQLELDAYRNELEAEHEAQTSSVFDECAEDSKMA
ncbi:helix-turn-helix domain-containing protein [Butyricicoccus pullicaecorum]|uniref:helix-turn-helix domain-containing protein n=1 Tax=Butyricicoccus pullicaecorum TaxID=501571 RepID=UPI0039908DB0